MKIELINPFLSAFERIFKEVTGDDISLSKTFRKEEGVPGEHMRVQYRVIGDVQGMVALELKMDVAKAIASAMMGGMVLPEMDEMARSAVSELGNMIAGRATSLIADQGYHLDITPPEIVQRVGVSQMPVLGFMFSNPNKTVEMNLALA